MGTKACGWKWQGEGSAGVKSSLQMVRAHQQQQLVMSEFPTAAAGVPSSVQVGGRQWDSGRTQRLQGRLLGQPQHPPLSSARAHDRLGATTDGSLSALGLTLQQLAAENASAGAGGPSSRQSAFLQFCSSQPPPRLESSMLQPRRKAQCLIRQPPVASRENVWSGQLQLSGSRLQNWMRWSKEGGPVLKAGLQRRNCARGSVGV